MFRPSAKIGMKYQSHHSRHGQFAMAHRFNSLFCLFALAAVSCVAPTLVGGQEVDFVTQIKPIFEEHCIACHGPSDEQAFRIDDRDATLGYVEAEYPEDSDLYLVLISEEEEEKMPPAVGKPMTESQITLVKTWISEGANWPEDLSAEDFKDVPLPDKEAETVFRAAGSLHPAAVHLPIGLLLASGLFAFLSLRGNFVMSDCAYYCLWLGTLGAIVSCATGWYFAWMQGYAPVGEVGDLLKQEDPMFMHRITGIGATVFALILALFAANARNKDPDDGMMWKLGAILLACAIGFVGHEGGELTYGADHYKDVEKLFQSFFPEDEKEDGDRTIDDDDESSRSEGTTAESDADSGSDGDAEEEDSSPADA
jgi:mono/diheme cytochrome c family protein/uncharacterized membrane protein